MDENLNLEYNNNSNKIWTCEKCQNMNLISDFRCLKCDYFNYDVYIENFKDADIGKETKYSDNQNTVIKPIMLKDEFIDYNFKEEYEFKRQEKHKFIKCWHCGRENLYYKVKCNYCRFPINDGEIPQIKKTQLSLYDVINNIKYNDNKKKKIEEKDNYRDIEIKYNKPMKENAMYKNLGNNWHCKYCKKLNRENTKYCQFCFRNRI